MQLPPGASFEHEVCLSFLYKGKYLVDIKYVFLIPDPGNVGCDGEGAREETSPSRTNRLDDSDSDRKDSKSPLDGTGGQRLPPLQAAGASTDFCLASSSLPVRFPSPNFSPQRQSPPLVHPKSAKAISRRFDLEFTTRRSSSQYSLTDRLSRTSPLSPAPLEDQVEVTCPHPNAIHPRPASCTHPNAMSPRPTSRHSQLRKTLQTASAGANLDETQAGPPHTSRSVSTKSVLVSAKDYTGVSTACGWTVPSKVQSSLLVSTNSKYQQMLQIQTSNPDLIRVMFGPNFTFHVN